jgi:ABC-type sugar transport system ATPase subunit
MVHQALSVLPDLTVAENLLLGREPVRFFVDAAWVSKLQNC